MLRTSKWYSWNASGAAGEMHRFRIIRDREHRDDDAMIAPIYREGPPWYCLVCCSQNEEHRGRCGYCNLPKGDWSCDQCGRKNLKADTECPECGTSKPDDE